jgi:DNA-binding beta-propeller fold protein YncE
MRGIAFDSKGPMYVTNFDVGPLAAGSVDVAPSATITGSRTELNEPFFGIAVDSSGKIYVTNDASPNGPTTITIYAPVVATVT